MNALERTRERFTTTNWADLLALRDASPEVRRRLTENLITRYWPSVYAYLRHERRSREDTADLTHPFLLPLPLGRSLFPRADASRGRLRALLLTALKRFVIDEHRRTHTHRPLITFSDELLAHEESKDVDGEFSTVDQAFERRWALALLEEAMRRCEAHFRESGRPNHWLIFDERVLRPAVSRNDSPPLAVSASAFGFDSPAMAAAAVQTVKRRLDALLREVVAETVRGPSSVDDELAAVKTALRG